MAVAFGSAGTYLAYASHTNSTLVAPASIANGDLLIAYLAIGLAGTAPAPTAPAGWTQLTGSPASNTSAGFNLNYHVFWKIAASESGNYTFTHTAASSCGIVVRYTGVDNSTPFTPTPTVNTGTASAGNSLSATATGFVTTVANTYIIFTEQDWGDNTTDTVPPTGTAPTFTERLDTVLIYIADGTLATTGATGGYSHVCNSASGNPFGAYLIGLNPSGGGGAPVTLNANPGSYTLTGTPAALGRQIINIGSAIDDGTGDFNRVAFDKCNRNFSDLYIADTTFLTTTAAAATYQPLDGDLTAIAALAGTNTIYYRSASNTWSPVNVSTGLAFSGGNLTAATAATQGNLVLITSTTVGSAVATVAFTSGLTSTYDEYEFHLFNVRPATTSTGLQMQVSLDSGSTWKTASTDYYYTQGVNGATPSGSNGADVAIWIGAANQSNGAGSTGNWRIWLASPASTTLYKVFEYIGAHWSGTPLVSAQGTGSYQTATSAINGIRFKYSSGNIAQGTFILYGVVK